MVLQSLAFNLGLDYEHSKASRIVRISRPDSFEFSGFPDLIGNFDSDLAGLNDLNAGEAFDLEGLLNHSSEQNLNLTPDICPPEVFDPPGASSCSLRPENNVFFDSGQFHYDQLMNPDDYFVPDFETSPSMENRHGNELPTTFPPTSNIDTPYVCAEDIPNCKDRIVLDDTRVRAASLFPEVNSSRDPVQEQQGGDVSQPFVGIFDAMLDHECTNQEIRFREGSNNITMKERIKSLVAKAHAVIENVQLDKKSTYQEEPTTSKRKRSITSLQSKQNAESSGNNFRRDSRHSSIHSASGSGYCEIVFDSNSVHSDRSQTSSSSGRRGPLSEKAKAGMKALKEVGNACWRCKFLKKTVCVGQGSFLYMD